MTDLLSLKVNILKAVSTLDEDMFDKGELKKVRTNDFISLDVPINDIELKSLLEYSQTTPSFFYKDRSSRESILALGANKVFTRKSDYNKILNIIEAWSDIYIFGGQRFDSNAIRDEEWSDLGECYFFVPIICFFSLEDNSIARVQIPKKVLSSSRDRAKFSFKLDQVLSFVKEEIHSPSFIDSVEVPQKTAWTNNIQSCLNAFSTSALDKIVLARKKVILNNGPLDSKYFLKNVDLNQNDSYTVFLTFESGDSFISVTPEKLFTLADQHISIDSIAGTRKRSTNINEDNDLGDELKNSFKDIQEHRFVTMHILEKIKDLNLDAEVVQKEEILKLKHVQHLHTKIIAKTDSTINFAGLINTFHPTPAVGGLPRVNAMKLINKIEGIDRGLYASPIGYINAKKSEFIVGIRSALINNDKLHVYGGAGIVNGSQADKEWEETGIKMNNFDKFFPDQRG